MSALKILGAGPVKRGVTMLAAEFGRRSGHAVGVEFTGAPAVSERVRAGEAVDVAVAPQAAMDELEKQGRILPETRGLVGRSRMGIAVRRGAPPPDLSTPEAFRQAVLAADAIVCNVASSGQYAIRLLGTLGLAEATQGRVIQLADAVKVMEHVAASPARALGVGQLAEISELIERGVAIALAAPLPDAIQNMTAYHAAVTAASRERAPAGELARFLAAPAAKAVLAATGID